MYTSCLRADVLPEPHPPCNLLATSSFKQHIYIYVYTQVPCIRTDVLPEPHPP